MVDRGCRIALAVGMAQTQRAQNPEGLTALPTPYGTVLLAALPAYTVLTPRQYQMAAMIHEGCLDKEIAARMGLTRGSVRVYMHALYERLPASTGSRRILTALMFDHREFKAIDNSWQRCETKSARLARMYKETAIPAIPASPIRGASPRHM
jgi:DNA-binding NarL/FixJ family response regulator